MRPPPYTTDATMWARVRLPAPPPVAAAPALGGPRLRGGRRPRGFAGLAAVARPPVEVRRRVARRPRLLAVHDVLRGLRRARRGDLAGRGDGRIRRRIRGGVRAREPHGHLSAAAIR